MSDGELFWGDDPVVRREGRIDGEHVIELDLDILRICRGRAADEQARKGGAGDCRRRRGDEIVGCLGFELAGAGRTRKGGDLAVGIAGAEKECAGNG